MKHKTYYDTFMSYLKNENKDQSVMFALSLLEEDKITIEDLYKDVLAPSLIHFECDVEDEEICIWKEHFRTSIIRTIIESSYTFILKRKKDQKHVSPKVVVLTPAFEYHEIGAIMVSHLMLLAGFDASYIGANTPKTEILSALRAYKPDYIALSVTNPYNIVVTEQVCREINKFFPDIKIILGGQAFQGQKALESITYDYLLEDFDAIKKFANEVLT